MTSRLFALALAGVTALAGCDRLNPQPAPEATEPARTPTAEQPAAPAAPPIGYACESGETVRVQYPDTATAQLTYKDQSYVMRIAPSGSGARYAGSGLEWWTASRNGLENATLSRLGPNEDVGVAVLERCSRPSANPDLPPPGPDGQTTGVAIACRVADLRLSVEEADAGAGNRAQTFGLTNVGTAPCGVSGYPAISLLDTQGRALTTVRSEQTPGAAVPVTLSAGAKAYFDIAWNVNPNAAQGETVCPSAARISIRLGTDPAALATPLALTPCGGRIRVNPIRATAQVVAPPTTA